MIILALLFLSLPYSSYLASTPASPTGLKRTSSLSNLILTEEQKACYKWYEDTKKQLPGGYNCMKSLSDDDQKILTDGTRYTEQPERMSLALHNAANAFYNK